MAKQEDTIRKLRKYLNSQNLYTSLRLTAAALIPAVLLYHFNLLTSAIALPLGAMFTGLTDSPGPVHHRRNSLAVSILFNFVLILIAGVLHNYTTLIIPALIVFGLFFSLLAVYGTRAGSIGLNALIVFIFNIDGHLLSNGHALREALLFAAGGVWYSILSLLLYSIRPYRLMQQMLGECLIEVANYLQVKGEFYGISPVYEDLNNRLIQHQISIRQMQEDLRELLFKTRSIAEESTTEGRMLMSVFLDSIDLMERIMTSQYDYRELHEKFGKANILNTIQTQLNLLSGELHDAGLAMQSGFPARSRRDLDALMEDTMNHFFRLREIGLNENNFEDFIALRQILFSLQDVTERIKRLRLSTFYKSKNTQKEKADVDLEKFITHSEIDPKLLLSNLNLQSLNFRHAIRLTVGLLLGYLGSLFFPLGHSYWILLTIAVIIKPAYGITRQRNLQRVGGTITGAVLGFGLLYLTTNTTFIFVSLVVAMVVSYSFLKQNYFVSSAGITLYVLLSFSFLNAAGFRTALNDRVIDTVIGSVIAWLVSWLVLPRWEHQHIETDIQKALFANRTYFDTVARIFLGQETDATTFKLHRKEAFVALANLSDTFHRMLSEPKSRQVNLSHYHQLVATSHTLTSYIASLSYFAQRTGKKYVSQEFAPLISQIDEQFDAAEQVLQHHQTVKASQMQPLQPVNSKVQELLAKRRQEISSGKGNMETSVRRTLSDLKSINDQFELISTATVDEVRILEKMV